MKKMHSLYKKKHYFSDKAVYTTKNELLNFLCFLDSNPIIQEFLRHDTFFRLADKYLIAMVFIYFKRAQLDPMDYTYLNFFAGLYKMNVFHGLDEINRVRYSCLAHSMEEDIELSSEIYPWALGNELKNELPRLLELKMLLWEAMDYRAVVSRHCCMQLISVSANHPIWRRERSPLHMTRFLSIKSEPVLKLLPEKEKKIVH